MNSVASKRALGSAVCLLSIGLLGSSAGAQQFIPAGQMSIDGIPVVCGNVPTILGGDEIGDVARATPDGIYLNWVRLSQFPTAMKMWTYAHECGHHLYGSDENTADAFATKLGRDQGWLSPWDINQICQGLWLSPGDWTHLPGPARCQMIIYYYNTP